MAASVSLIGLTIRLPLALWLATRWSPVSMSSLYEALLMPVAAAVAAGVAAGVLRFFVFVDAVPTIAGVLSVGAAGVSAAGLVMLTSREMRRELRLLAGAGLRLLRHLLKPIDA